MNLDQFCGVLALLESFALCCIVAATQGHDGVWPRFPRWLRMLGIVNAWFISVRGLDLLFRLPGGSGHVDIWSAFAWLFGLFYFVGHFVSLMQRTQEPAVRIAYDRLKKSLDSEAKGLRRAKAKPR